MTFKQIGTLAGQVLLKAERTAKRRALRLEGGPPHHAGDSEPPAPGSTALRRNAATASTRNGMEKGPTGKGRAKVVRQKGGPDDFGALIDSKAETTRSMTTARRRDELPPSSAVVILLSVERARRYQSTRLPSVVQHSGHDL